MSKKLTNNNDIVILLEKLGFDDKEIRVYLALLRLGSGSVAEIAREASLRRPHVYNVLMTLGERGLVTELTEHKKKTYQAEDPQVLQKMLGELGHKLEGVLPSLVDLYQEAPHKPNVIFYKGRAAYFAIAERSIEHAESEILFLSSTDYFHEIFSEADEEGYIKKRVRVRKSIRMLTPENEWAQEIRKRDERELRQTRFLPRDYQFTSTMFVYGNEVGFLTSGKEMVGVVIESKEINSMMRIFFEIAWNVST